MKKYPLFITVLCSCLLLIQPGCTHTGEAPCCGVRSPKDMDETQTAMRTESADDPWKVQTSSDPWQLKENIMLQRNYAAADKLAQQLERARLRKQDPILVTTIADVNYVESSSAFGRITGEQIASRLAQLGFSVTEVKVRGSLYVQRGSGEYILSRNIEDIASQHEVVAVVTGTYAVGGMENLISLRAVELSTRKILAGYDYAVPNVPRLFPNPRVLY